MSQSDTLTQPGTVLGTIHAMVDTCQIAAVAIAHDCALLTTDTDFEHIAGLSPLRLVRH